MSKATSKKPQRNWGLLFGLGIPLLVAGGGAMVITFATLIDVAHLAGLPFPVFFPFVVDGGMIGCMVAATEFKRRGISGSKLAWFGFIVLSMVSVLANAMHARLTADLEVMAIWAVTVIGAIPSAVLLLMTRLIENMVPDEKERARLHTIRDRAEQQARTQAAPAKRTAPTIKPTQVTPAPTVSEAAEDAPTPLRLVKSDVADSRDAVRARVLEHIEATGKKPTGAEVGEWLGGKSPKTGQRFLTQISELTAEEKLAAHA